MKTKFPRQKIASSKKGKKWRESHLKWVDDLFLLKDSPVRNSLKNRISLFKLFLGTASKGDYDVLLNPSELSGIFIPDNIQHYPIAKPYLNVLIGEEADRRFEWRAVVTNPTAISTIEQDKSKMMIEKLSALIEDKSLSEEDAVKQFKNFLYYLKFEYQDLREKRANLLVKHFIKELDIKIKFNEGMKNVLIVGEEGYIADIVNGNMRIELMDPKKTFVIRSGYSNKYEDADVIVTYDYVSRGKLLDMYHTTLTEKQVKWLDEDAGGKYGNDDGGTLDNDEYGINIAREQMMDDMLKMPGETYDGKSSPHSNSEIVDKYGNVRYIRVFWKSMKAIQRIKFYDEQGNPQFRFESEIYKVREDLGEETEKYWITEWWEGGLAGKDIYTPIKPREIQYNKFSDPSYNHPGIVGQVYNTGNMEVVSYMETAKPYQLLYDATMHRLQDALSKYFGSMPVVDYATLPEGWDITKWMYFARKAGIAVKDSFKEGMKGAATGKLAASVQGSTGQVINQPLGDFIQQQINILNYVEMQMGRIIGVPPQRLGQIENRETVGGVERAVTQSSFITNEVFKIHDNVKKRVLTLLLETAKIAMKNNPKKFQYIGDDHLAQLFDVDDEFLEEEFGILIDNENDLTKIEQTFEQLAHAAMQNQALKFSDLMKIFTTSSLSEKQRIIEQGEEDMIQRNEAVQERQDKQVQAQMQAEQAALQRAEAKELQFHNDELLMEKYKVDQDNLTKRMAMDESIDDTDMTGDQKLDLEYRKLEDDLMLRMKDLNEQIRNNKAKEIIDNKKASQTKPAAK